MNLKQIVSNKKFKNAFITICEILFVAGLIFGILMFLQSKINKDANQNAKINGIDTLDEEETTEGDKGSDKYYIEVNMKKNAMIVYQYSSDKKSKNPYKVFNCSIGGDVKKGKYKTTDNYSWVDTDGSWHKYNTQFAAGSWIQSAGYSNKYDNTLKKASYRAIGKKQKSGSSIMLYARDAKWIFGNCKNTTVNIIKGSKNDKLPKAAEKAAGLTKYCGWDPTDPDKSNPYQKCKNGQITTGLSTVYVEREEKPQYLSNLIAKDENGKNISNSLKYKEFSTENTGTYKVTYTYKTKSGKKLKAVQKFEVIDTIPPKVTCAAKKFKYEVLSQSEEDLNTDDTRKTIESLVRKSVSCNESNVNITVSTVSKDELKIGNNVVIVKAQDKAGNVGSCQVICEISIKEKQYNEKYQPKKKEKVTKKAKKKKPKEKETTKKAEKETTKNASDNRSEETTTVNE